MSSPRQKPKPHPVHETYNHLLFSVYPNWSSHRQGRISYIQSKKPSKNQHVADVVPPRNANSTFPRTHGSITLALLVRIVHKDISSDRNNLDPCVRLFVRPGSISTDPTGGPGVFVPVPSIEPAPSPSHCLRTAHGITQSRPLHLRAKMPTLALTNFNIVVTVLGGWISLFGLVSYLVKENFYLSEARKYPHALLPSPLRP